MHSHFSLILPCRFGITVGWNALHEAARYGHAELLSALAAAGGDLEAMTRCRYTALHLAAGKGHGAVVARLLELRAAVAPRDRDGQGALELLRMVKLLSVTQR